MCMLAVADAAGCDDCHVSEKSGNKCFKRGTDSHICECNREQGWRTVSQGRACLEPHNHCLDEEDWCRTADNAKNSCHDNGNGTYECKCANSNDDGECSGKWCANPTKLRCEEFSDPCVDSDPCVTAGSDNTCTVHAENKSDYTCHCEGKYRISKDGLTCEEPDLCLEMIRDPCNLHATDMYGDPLVQRGSEKSITKGFTNKCRKSVVKATDDTPAHPGYYCDCAENLGWESSPAQAGNRLQVGTEKLTCIATNHCAKSDDPCNTKANIGNSCAETQDGWYTCHCNEAQGWNLAHTGGSSAKKLNLAGTGVETYQGAASCSYTAPAAVCDAAAEEACHTDMGNSCSIVNGAPRCTCLSSIGYKDGSAARDTCVHTACSGHNNCLKGSTCREITHGGYYCQCNASLGHYSTLVEGETDIQKNQRCVEISENHCLVGDPCNTRGHRTNQCTWNGSKATCTCTGRWVKTTVDGQETCLPPGNACDKSTDPCQTQGNPQNVCVDGGGSNTFACECNQPGYFHNALMTKCMCVDKCLIGDPCATSEESANKCSNPGKNSSTQCSDSPVKCTCGNGWTPSKDGTRCIPPNPCDNLACDPCQIRSNPRNRCVNTWTRPITAGNDPFEVYQTNKYANAVGGPVYLFHPLAGNDAQSTYSAARGNLVNTARSTSSVVYTTAQPTTTTVRPSTTQYYTMVNGQKVPYTGTTTGYVRAGTTTRQNVHYGGAFNSATSTDTNTVKVHNYASGWNNGVVNAINTHADPNGYQCQCYGSWMAPIGSQTCEPADPCVSNPCGTQAGNVCVSNVYNRGERSYVCMCGAIGFHTPDGAQSCEACHDPCQVGDPCNTVASGAKNTCTAQEVTSKQIPGLLIQSVSTTLRGHGTWENHPDRYELSVVAAALHELGSAVSPVYNEEGFCYDQQDCFDTRGNAEHINSLYCMRLVTIDQIVVEAVTAAQEGNCSTYTCSCSEEYNLQLFQQHETCTRCHDPCLSDPCSTRSSGEATGNVCKWVKDVAGTPTEITEHRQYAYTHVDWPTLSKAQRLQHYFGYLQQGDQVCGTYECSCEGVGYVVDNTDEAGASCTLCTDPCANDPCFTSLDPLNECVANNDDDFCAGYTCTCRGQGYQVDATQQTCDRCVNPCDSDADPCNVKDLSSNNVCTPWTERPRPTRAPDAASTDRTTGTTTGTVARPATRTDRRLLQASAGVRSSRCYTYDANGNEVTVACGNTATNNVVQYVTAPTTVSSGVVGTTGSVYTGTTTRVVQPTTTVTRVVQQPTTTTIVQPVERDWVIQIADDHHLPNTVSCGAYQCTCDDAKFSNVALAGGEICLRNACPTAEQLCEDGNACDVDPTDADGKALNTCEVVSLNTYLEKDIDTGCPLARKCTCGEGYIAIYDSTSNNVGMSCYELPKTCRDNACNSVDANGDAIEGNSCVIDDVIGGDYHCECLAEGFSVSADTWQCVPDRVSTTPRPTRNVGRNGL